MAEELIVTLSAERRGRPYHRQVYEQVRAAILAGRLRPGDRLPATRDLAARLGLARNTVARAYSDLLAEGYLSGRVGAGTFVAPELQGGRLEDERTTASAPGDAGRYLTSWGHRTLGSASGEVVARSLPYDFRPGTPDWGAFPRTLWLRLLGGALRRGVDLNRYGDPAGHLPLRQAIARHLAVSRGVNTAGEQIVIVSGSQQALDLISRLYVGPGDAVAVEDPGYPEACRAFAAAGARLIGVPVDADGARVECLDGAPVGEGPPAPRLVYLTPSHQFPTGSTLTLHRRLSLLEWAANRDVLVVEDDYDSEIRSDGRPVESLQGLDRTGRVVYLGTFSTMLFPPLRVGYVVLPPDLVGSFVQAKLLADRQTPTLEQLALTEFLEQGHFERHLRRMRRLAAARQKALLAALAEHLDGLVESPRATAGMHLMLTLARRARGPEEATNIERAIVNAAAARGVGVYPVGAGRAAPSSEVAVVLGYAGLAEREIHEGVRRLAEAIAEAAMR